MYLHICGAILYLPDKMGRNTERLHRHANVNIKSNQIFFAIFCQRLFGNYYFATSLPLPSHGNDITNRHTSKSGIYCSICWYKSIYIYYFKFTEYVLTIHIQLKLLHVYMCMFFIYVKCNLIKCLPHQGSYFETLASVSLCYF